MARRQGAAAVDELWPITELGAEADVWEQATWIGQVDEAHLFGRDVLIVVGGERFERARLLVWCLGQPRGFVDVVITLGAIRTADVIAETSRLASVLPRERAWPTPPMTAAVCTRDRPQHLRAVLENLADLDYPLFDVLVVDNNPTSGITRSAVEAFNACHDISVRVVDADGEGLSIARNVAAKNAEYDIIAFTDDDVVVDNLWLHNLAYGFSRSDRVACVCGMVPTAELTTAAQSYFDKRVGWARRCEPAVFDLADPPNEDPLFPMRVAQYGTGANFALRRSALFDMGGFDEGLGVGSPAGGGEDIDIFVRVLLAGHVLVREPSAVVWHRHRRTPAELVVQVDNYGLGLGAWIAKIAMHPRTLAMALRRALPAVKHLRRVTVVDQELNGPPDRAMEALYGRELRGVLKGPMALTTSRLAGRSPRPLRNSSSIVAQTFDFRRGRNWGDPGNSIVAGRMSVAAILLGMFGLLGAIPMLPTTVLGLLIGAFVLGGPGCLALSFRSQIPNVVLVPIIPAVSLAVCIIVVAGSLMLGYFEPATLLLGMAGLTVIGGCMRCAYLARRQDSTVP